MSQKLNDAFFSETDPAPNTLYNGRYTFGFYRTPKTLREIRDAADPEMTPFIRGSRSLTNLPNAWDDRPPARKKVYTDRQAIRTRKNFRETIRHG
jgi:hypothetical protein